MYLKGSPLVNAMCNLLADCVLSLCCGVIQCDCSWKLCWHLHLYSPHRVFDDQLLNSLRYYGFRNPPSCLCMHTIFNSKCFSTPCLLVLDDMLTLVSCGCLLVCQCMILFQCLHFVCVTQSSDAKEGKHQPHLMFTPCLGPRSRRRSWLTSPSYQWGTTSSS